MTRIEPELRREVINRAGNCREYCLLSQEDYPFTFHIEHIIAEKHRGKTVADNLCLSCPDCNVYKGSDMYPKYEQFHPSLHWLSMTYEDSRQLTK